MSRLRMCSRLATTIAHLRCTEPQGSGSLPEERNGGRNPIRAGAGLFPRPLPPAPRMTAIPHLVPDRPEQTALEAGEPERFPEDARVVLAKDRAETARADPAIDVGQ